MTNGLANGVWKKAGWTALSIGCGVLSGEAIVGDLKSWHGLLHVIAVTVAAVFVAEVRYWKSYADKQLEDSRDSK